jgi:hypothetical protein
MPSPSEENLNLNIGSVGIPPDADASEHPALRGVTTERERNGVVGVNYGNNSLGLLGGTDYVFNQNAGVYGESDQQGVLGHATTDAGTGVFGNSKGGGFGVRGESVTGTAVQGRSFGGGFAGKFIGNVHIDGNLDLQKGNVHIDGSLFLPKGGDIGLQGGNIAMNGGDIYLSNGDCAEEFDIACLEQVEPGTVMVIDSDGALQPSTQAYDKRVAGVISGAGNYKPGLILDKQESSNNRMPIALMGKVYCKVDAEYGAIEVGDLMTTSPTPGHAMKATDPLKAFGAVIGKALRPLKKNQGLIPILIALQ